MARVQLNCSCGWVFFVSDCTANLVKCPSCGDDVRVPGARAGAKMSPSQIAQEKEKQRKLIILAGTAITGCVLLLAVVFLLMSGGKKPVGGRKISGTGVIEEMNSGRVPGSSGTRGVPITPGPQGRPNSFVVPSPVADTGGDKVDWERRMALAVYKLNVAGLTGELLRVRGDTETAEQMDDAMMHYKKEMDDAMDKLREERGTAPVIPMHMLPGDRITFFESVNFATTSVKEKDSVLSGWLRNKLQAGAMAQVSIKRDDMDIPLIINFNECPRDLRVITKAADVDLAESQVGGVINVKPKPKEAIPADVAKDVREGLFGLHPYYQQLFAEDRARIETLLAEGKADVSDINWLKTRVVEVRDTVKNEISFFTSQISELEPRIKAADTADTILMRNGEKKEGKIIRETEEEIELQIKVGGITGSRRIKKEDIREIQRGKGPATEFSARFAKSRDNATALASLLQFCREKNLGVQKEITCYALLLKDPGHEGARKELGYSRSSEGSFSRGEKDAVRKGDKILYDGKELTLSEFLAYLKTQGYVEVNGVWCEKRDWSFRIDNLYTDEKKLRYQGNCVIMARETTQTRAQYDPATKQYKNITIRVENGRFLGPSHLGDPRAGREGAAEVVIEAPGEFLSARVKAVAELTVNMGQVTVSVALDNGASEQMLYSLSSMGRNEESHDVSSVVRGSRRFIIKARMAGAYSPLDTGTIMFLPSTRNTRGVLDVRAKIAQPLNKINEILRSVTGITPGTPNPTTPGVAPSNTQDVEQLQMQIVAIADTVTKETDLFKDVILNVRDATRNYKYPGQVTVPPDFADIVRYIGTDPTTFDPSALDSKVLLEIGGWWSKLKFEDRKRFARFFALYTAMFRHYKGQ